MKTAKVASQKSYNQEKWSINEQVMDQRKCVSGFQHAIFLFIFFSHNRLQNSKYHQFLTKKQITTIPKTC